MKLLPLALALCLLLSPAPTSDFSVMGEPEKDYVFDGKPDYEYFSDGLQIGIKCIQENDITYYAADIRADSPERLKTAKAAWFESENNKGAKSEKVSVIAERKGAVLAINADNYKNSPFGVIVRNGKLVRKNSSTRETLMISKEGDLLLYSVKARVSELLRAVEENGVRESFCFGPILVQDGQPVEFPKGFKLIATRDSTLEPRTAIGQLGPLRYLIIVVDGRREGHSEGINLRGLQQLFINYGVTQAFNLDGGGSTTLYFNGEVINRPSGNRERSVTDILYFK